MSDNEKELFNIIHEHDNPGQVLELAIELMADFLAEREVPQDTSFAHLRVTA